MPEFKEHAPGTFCYAELATSDLDGGKAFYTGLFGWTASDEDTPHGTYTQFHQGKHVCAAIYRLMPEQIARNVPPNWGNYITVKDVDRTLARAADLGGKALMGPMDVMDLGRMAVLADPAGAIFCLWQPGRNCGVGVRNEPGSICWHELMTDDTAVAAAFYGDLLDWQVQTMDLPGFPPYTAFSLDEQTWTAGMMAIQPEMGPVPPHWLVYFAVETVDDAFARALELGGTGLVPPTDIPGHGRFAVIRDPQGAVFGMHESAGQ